MQRFTVINMNELVLRISFRQDLIEIVNAVKVGSAADFDFLRSDNSSVNCEIISIPVIKDDNGYDHGKRKVN